jgi:hypothetical protein
MIINRKKTKNVELSIVFLSSNRGFLKGTTFISIYPGSTVSIKYIYQRIHGGGTLTLYRKAVLGANRNRTI